MYNLIRNENMKLYRRWRTWIMVGFLIGTVLLGSFLEWHYDGKEGEAWQGEVQEEKLHYEENLKNPNLEVENKTYIQDRIAILDYHLEHDIRTSDGTNVS